MAVIEVGRLSDATQIFGSKSLDNGTIVYKPGLFTEAIQTPGCVIHLQELNRPENDKALNAIFSVLDETFRSVYLDEIGSLIKVAPGVTFFATINEGFQFIGTMPVDEALENRFALRLTMGYLPERIEVGLLVATEGMESDAASEIITVANALRHNTQNPVHISVRQTIEMARLIQHGMTVIDAFTYCVSAESDVLEGVLLNYQLEGKSDRATALGNLTDDVYQVLK